MSAPPDGAQTKPYDGSSVLTADRVPIVDGLRVWTNDLETGAISLDDAEFEWNRSEKRYVLWFRVIRDGRDDGRGVLQSDDRVATRNPFNGSAA